MTADQLLAHAIATRLSGDSRQVATLFQDDAFHARLALAPDPGGPTHYSPQPYDGWYFIHCGDEYQVYYQEGKVRKGLIRFARGQDAATHFSARRV